MATNAWRESGAAAMGVMADGRSDRFGFRAVAILGVVQGLAIHLLAEAGNWRDERPGLLLGGWAVVLLVPLTAQLLMPYRHRRSSWLVLAAVTAVAMLAGWHAGVLVPADGRGSGGAEVAALVWGLGLAWFARLAMAVARLNRPPARDAAGDGRSDGEVGDPGAGGVFPAGLRHLLTIAAALLLVLLLFLILKLWGALFALIGIDVFERLFDEDLVLYPALGAAFGLGLAVLLEWPALIEGVRRAVIAVATLLLPLVTLIHLGFLGAVAVVGVGPLWETGYATALLLALLLVFVVLANAGAARAEGTPKWLVWPVRAAMLLSPAYAGLCIVALWLRVAQYGWSPDRVGAALAVAVASVAALAYAATAVAGLRGRNVGLGRANVAIAIALVVAGTLPNTPLLPPQRIAAGSQLARLEAGRVTADAFDWRHLRFELGPYGLAALERLAASEDAAVAERAQATLALDDPFRPDAPVDLAGRVTVLPQGTPPPDDYLRFLAREGGGAFRRCQEACRVLAVDLDGDGTDEFVTITPAFGEVHARGVHGGSDPDAWGHAGWLQPSPDVRSERPSEADLAARIAAGAWHLEPSRRQDVVIDGMRFHWR